MGLTEHMWMPMCALYIGNPSDILWWVIFLQLKVSAICTLFWSYYTYSIDEQLLKLNMRGRRIAHPGTQKLVRNLGLLGNLLFTAHCCILDGCIWSFYFNAE